MEKNKVYSSTCHSYTYYPDYTDFATQYLSIPFLFFMGVKYF